MQPSGLSRRSRLEDTVPNGEALAVLQDALSREIGKPDMIAWTDYQDALVN
jgi:hypothetical protein